MGVHEETSDNELVELGCSEHGFVSVGPILLDAVAGIVLEAPTRNDLQLAADKDLLEQLGQVQRRLHELASTADVSDREAATREEGATR